MGRYTKKRKRGFRTEAYDSHTGTWVAFNNLSSYEQSSCSNSSSSSFGSDYGSSGGSSYDSGSSFSSDSSGGSFD